MHYQQHFESHATVEDFTDMDQDTCLFFHQDFSKHHETKINGDAFESYHLPKNTIPHFKEHCTKKDDISVLIIRFFFSQTILAFIDILDSFWIAIFLPSDFCYSTDF